MRFAAWLLAAPLLVACSVACENTILTRVDAPNGRHSAVVFRRDCGATTGFSAQVSVLKRGDRPSNAGNVFVADDDHGAATTGPNGVPWAEAVWQDENRLLIRYDAKARIFQHRAEASGVRVRYEAVAR